MYSPVSIDVPQRKNISLDFFIIRTKSALLKFKEACRVNKTLKIAENDSENSQMGLQTNIEEASKEVCSNLRKINQQADYTRNEEQYFRSLVERELYSILGNLNTTDMDQELFDEQAISFRRLVGFMLKNDSMDGVLQRKVSKALGLYLINFSDYYEMESHQIVYVKSMMTGMLELYDRYRVLIDSWFEILATDKEVQTLLLEKTSSLAKVSSTEYKYFPLYDLIRSFTFVDEDKSQYVNFINLCKLNNERLVKWFLYNSDITTIFVEKLSDCFNQSCMIKGYIAEFECYLTLFYSVVEICPSALSAKLFDNFEKHFMNEVFKMNTNKISILHVLKVIGTSVHFKLDGFCNRLFENMLLQEFLGEMSNSGQEVRMMLLETINEMVSNDVSLIKTLFSLEHDECEDIKIDGLRIKAMNACMSSSIDSLGSILCQDIDKFRSLGFHIFDDSKQLSQFILHSLLTFYQNSTDFNIVLMKMIKTLHYKVNLVSNRKFNHVLEFLYEAYQNYLEMINKVNLEKYDTLDNEGTSHFEYLTPTSQFMTQLKINVKIESNRQVQIEHVTKNVELFKELIFWIYSISKFKNIEVKRRNAVVH